MPYAQREHELISLWKDFLLWFKSDPGLGLCVGIRSKKSRPRKVNENLDAWNDIVGIVMLEIQSAENLPMLKNSELFLVFRSVFLGSTAFLSIVALIIINS